MAQKRITKELNNWTSSSAGRVPEGFIVVPVKGDAKTWRIAMPGPQGSPYEDGYFVLKATFPSDYPFKPPSVRFETRLYHCQIDRAGDVSLDILRDCWSPACTMLDIAKILHQMLSETCPNNPLDSHIAFQFCNARHEHDRIARAWTQQHAKEHPSWLAAEIDGNDMVLTVHCALQCHGSFSIVCITMSGAEAARFDLGEDSDVAALVTKASKTVSVPAWRLKLCLPSGRPLVLSGGETQLSKLLGHLDEGAQLSL